MWNTVRRQSTAKPSIVFSTGRSSMPWPIKQYQKAKLQHSWVSSHISFQTLEQVCTPHYTDTKVLLQSTFHQKGKLKILLHPTKTWHKTKKNIAQCRQPLHLRCYCLGTTITHNCFMPILKVLSPKLIRTQFTLTTECNETCHQRRKG